MRVLAIDTATEACGAALIDNGRVAFESSIAHGRTHAAYLMEAVQAVMAMARIDLKQVDGFAVTRGPGSFTGLRIGISTIKGLALAIGKPLVGVSSLNALAHQCMGVHEWICPIVDARRKQVYWSLYQHDGQGLAPREPERVGRVEDILKRITGPCLCVGNGALLHKELLVASGAVLAAQGRHTLRAGVVGVIGHQRLTRGEEEDLSAFTPVYIRPSDAQIDRGS